jgi:hypothetical protein
MLAIKLPLKAHTNGGLLATNKTYSYYNQYTQVRVQHQMQTKTCTHNKHHKEFIPHGTRLL